MSSLAAARGGSGPTVVLVHGFTQTNRSMAPLASRLGEVRTVAVDLPGHGGSAAVSADLEASAALVADAAEGEPFHVVGYSLGGRVALHVACQAPEGLAGVVAISASPGIRDEAARERRARRDAELAEGLESTGDLDGFLERWLRNPLFATLPRSSADLDARRENTVAGLADSLRRCSVGVQRWLGDELVAGSVPVHLVCGARDEPFVASACELASRGGSVDVAVVPGAGHVAHLEQPALTARLVRARLVR